MNTTEPIAGARGKLVEGTAEEAGNATQAPAHAPAEGPTPADVAAEALGQGLEQENLTTGVPAEADAQTKLIAGEASADTVTDSREVDDGVDLHCVGEISIIVLDDEPMICKAIQTALARKDFVIDTVSDPAVMELQLRAKRYHVVILDYVIPGLNFERIISWLQEFQPNAGIIVVTGHPSVDSALNCLRARTFDYLTKPFQLSDLKRVVMSCLESKGLLRMSEEALRVALGGAIRERRKAVGLTLAQVAQRANVSLGYLSQIELGKNSASVETLYRISLGLGIKMAELFRSIQVQ